MSLLLRTKLEPEQDRDDTELFASASPGPHIPTDPAALDAYVKRYNDMCMMLAGAEEEEDMDDGDGFR